MAPFFKVLSLVIKLFTKPLANYLKNTVKYKNDHPPYTRQIILNLGQFYHRTNIKIQRRMMNMSSNDSYIKPLTEEKALENGAEFIGEFITYGTLITFGLYEINKAANQSEEKEKKFKQCINDAHDQISAIEKYTQEILEKVEIVKVLQNCEKIDAETNTDE